MKLSKPKVLYFMKPIKDLRLALVTCIQKLIFFVLVRTPPKLHEFQIPQKPTFLPDYYRTNISPSFVS